jgi:peptide chain release factor 2
MRERQQLEAALAAYEGIQAELDDNVTLAALGEEEGDENIVAEAEDALRKLRQDAHKREVEALLSGEADANDAYAERAAPKARIGPRCWSACICAGRRTAATKSS